MRQRVYKYRFEIHLPTLDNDGRPIPLEQILQAFSDLRSRFTGFTTSSYVGFPNWFGWYRAPDGQEYWDNIYLVYVDVEDRQVTDAISYFQDFRTKYVQIFGQSEIYIIYYPVTKVE